ncbi:MAG: hypothetical protein R3B40_10665 [Polyangiales bacterium]
MATQEHFFRYSPALALVALAIATSGCDVDAGARPDGGVYQPDGGYPDGGYEDAGYDDAGYDDGGYEDGGYTCDPSNPYYGNGPIPEPDPNDLLWARHGGWAVWDYCICKPDETPIGPDLDPRTHVNRDAAGPNILFNVAWKDCHMLPDVVGEEGMPTTCGELRARVAEGARLMVPGAAGGGALFSGNNYRELTSGFGIATFPATAYNNMWMSWGLDERPDNFDFLVGQRVGSPFGPVRNPYPLYYGPGDPRNEVLTGSLIPGVDSPLDILSNVTLTPEAERTGGSGTMPYFFTHLRDEDGSYTGRIGITCQGCHTGSIGDATAPDMGRSGYTEGSGSPLADHNLFLYDMLPRGYAASFVFWINLSKTRGVNNASDVNLAFLFPDNDAGYDFGTLGGLLTTGTSAGMDTPAWWNMGHRTAKFVDGLFPMDAPRVDMVFYTPIVGLFGVVGDGVTFLVNAVAGVVDMVGYIVTLALNAIGLGPADVPAGVFNIINGVFNAFGIDLVDLTGLDESQNTDIFQAISAFISVDEENDGQQWMRDHGVAINDWALTLKSPEYPGNVDRQLAEEGAVLFHELNLWQAGSGPGVPTLEGGNGSCSTCHGVYAPRYANDPNWLSDPALIGQAAYITPIDIIGTDRVRFNVNDQAMNEAGRHNFFGYAELQDEVAAGNADYCGPQNHNNYRDPVAAPRNSTARRALGYLAQPLHGVWSTGPYLHNGSVPNLRGVLDSSARPDLFRRFTTPTPSNFQQGEVMMGYDTSLTRAFDHDNVGWRYQTYQEVYGRACDPVGGVTGALDCFQFNPLDVLHLQSNLNGAVQCVQNQFLGQITNQHRSCDPTGVATELLDTVLTFAQDNLILVWNLLYAPMDVTDFDSVNNRTWYNTRMYGQGNGGHTFGDGLTDHQRDAIIEYLKTL